MELYGHANISSAGQNIYGVFSTVDIVFGGVILSYVVFGEPCKALYFSQDMWLVFYC